MRGQGPYEQVGRMLSGAGGAGLLMRTGPRISWVELSSYFFGAPQSQPPRQVRPKYWDEEKQSLRERNRTNVEEDTK